MLPETDRTFLVLQQRQHPFAPALLCVLLNGLHDLFSGELLVVSHDVLKFASWRCFGDQMNMVAHDAPRKELQSLFLLAEGKTLHYDILVDWSAKRVHPANHRIAQEVQVFLVMDLVLAAHESKVAGEMNGTDAGRAGADL